MDINFINPNDLLKINQAIQGNPEINQAIQENLEELHGNNVNDQNNNEIELLQTQNLIIPFDNKMFFEKFLKIIYEFMYFCFINNENPKINSYMFERILLGLENNNENEKIQMLIQKFAQYLKGFQKIIQFILTDFLKNIVLDLNQEYWKSFIDKFLEEKTKYLVNNCIKNYHQIYTSSNMIGIVVSSSIFAYLKILNNLTPVQEKFFILTNQIQKKISLSKQIIEEINVPKIFYYIRTLNEQIFSNLYELYEKQIFINKIIDTNNEIFNFLEKKLKERLKRSLFFQFNIKINLILEDPIKKLDELAKQKLEILTIIEDLENQILKYNETILLLEEQEIKLENEKKELEQEIEKLEKEIQTLEKEISEINKSWNLNQENEKIKKVILLLKKRQNVEQNQNLIKNKLTETQNLLEKKAKNQLNIDLAEKEKAQQQNLLNLKEIEINIYFSEIQKMKNKFHQFHKKNTQHKNEIMSKFLELQCEITSENLNLYKKELIQLGWEIYQKQQILWGNYKKNINKNIKEFKKRILELFNNIIKENINIYFLTYKKILK